ncbi:MAG: NAD-dependent succinate-semialdehyde dehydrogenase [Alphaproteobacteria bacterium]|nr:NAD-dependent succinate-semialdehyde dehydrogenase [Alphaproteobacteria bacterium]
MSDHIFPLFIAGDWVAGSDGVTGPVLDPATEEPIGALCHAGEADLQRAIASAEKGLREWSRVSAWDRGAILHKAAQIIRARRDDMALVMTREQGKPLAQAAAEIDRAADFIEWGGEEGRRVSGRTSRGRDGVSRMIVDKVPIGVVAALTPWNFPMVLVAKKLGALLGAGCSCVLKPAEETPGSAIELVKALLDAGLPGDAVNVVFGVPDEISRPLIAAPAIRKVTFTGSIPVGKLLAARAGEHMKPVTMELGGHSAVVVFDDVDVDAAARLLAQRKFFNSGQVCVSPTRFMVHDKVYEEFVDRFAAAASGLKIGAGKDPATEMGPLANDRRLAAIERMVDEAVDKGANVVTGGSRAGNRGYFFEPTVLTGVPADSDMMTVEPFGPVAPIAPFSDPEAALEAANGLEYGLASYLFTARAEEHRRFIDGFQSGLVGVNDVPPHFPESPLGGWKDSGYGVEGGTEALDPYLKTKLVGIYPPPA